MSILIGQIIGFAAMGVSASIYWQRNRKCIIFLKLISDVLWVINCYLIGSYTASVTTSIAIGREIVFYNKGKKWASHKGWTILFPVLFFIATTFTWKNIYSIIPAISSSFSTWAFWCSNIVFIKVIGLIPSIGMLIYNWYHHSWAGVADSIFSIVAIIASFVIIACEKKSKKSSGVMSSEK